MVAVLLDQAGTQVCQAPVQFEAVVGEDRLHLGGERAQPAQAVLHAGRGQCVVAVQAGGTGRRGQPGDRGMATPAVAQWRGARPLAQGGHDLHVVRAFFVAVFTLRPEVLLSEQCEGAGGIAQRLVLAGDLAVESPGQLALGVGGGERGEQRAQLFVQREFGQRPATVALGPGFGQAGMLLRRQCVAGEGLQVVALQVVRELAHRTGGLAGGAGQFTGGGCRALAGTQRKDQGQQQCGGSGGTEGPEARWRHGRRRHPVGPRRVWRQPGGAGKASGKKKGGAWPPQSGRTGGHRVVARLRPRAGRGHPSATQELRQHLKLNNASY